LLDHDNSALCVAANLTPLSRVESRKQDVLGWITVIVVLLGRCARQTPRQRLARCL